MSEELLKKIADELSEMRKMMAEVVKMHQAADHTLQDIYTEQAIVDAQGIDRVAYLKNKYKTPRSVKSKHN